MGQRIKLSVMRHLIIAFGRDIDSSSSIPGELSREEVDEMIDEAADEDREMQAGHSAATARAVYAVDIQSIFDKKFNRAQGQFRVSQKWHSTIGFELDETFAYLETPIKAPIAATGLAERLQCNYKRLLQENFGNTAEFRPQQKDVIQAIMGGETVVHRIRTSVWKDGHCDQTASIILATPEALAQTGFQEMAQRLSTMGKLERIVVDQFHYVLLPNHEYRPHLLQLRQLTRFGARLTLLLATIPVEDQVYAFRLMGIPTDTIPFRTSTSRPNLRWQVKEINLSSKENVPELASYIQSEAKLTGKLLVYVETIALIESLSTELNCYKYHAQMSMEDRATN
ncbi:hypothetical protein NX059_012156 [Plenodomus lindquistii]|nr:hypothetical protein NX059_012156 [Plenodomus lindquistii]